MTRIAVVGGGRIGEALIAGLRESGTEASDIVVIEPVPARAEQLSKKYSVLATELEIGCEGADVIVVAVKPGDVPAATLVLGHAAPHAGVLAGLQGPREALGGDGATVADDLGLRDLGEGRAGVADGEEQLGILFAANGIVTPVHDKNSLWSIPG